MNKKDGMNYAPKGKFDPVVTLGEFSFAAIGLDHGHIFGMCNGFIDAGATLSYVYDPDPNKVAEFLKVFPDVKPVACEDEIFDNQSVKLVATAAIPADRCALGLRAMDAGKDFFSDKAPFTSLEQLASARKKVTETGKKYMVYYGERLHSECAIFAGDLIRDGAIGRVLQVIGLGPHRLNAPTRPEWFFKKELYGGILCDIGSHQIEQFLFYSGAKDATILSSRVANYANPEYPELEDFGEAMLVGDNGTSNYFRVDWFTPDGLSSWGDGRTIIQGTEGYMELRKYINIATEVEGDHIFLANRTEERKISVHGQVGFPFFGQLILDCLNRTENAMTQEHAFKAAELCIKAQMLADGR